MTELDGDEDRRVFEALRRIALEVVPELPESGFTWDRTLSELGCNSIDRAEIVTLTMEELGITVPVHEFHQGHDIGALVRVMRTYS
ncbi:MULTISPECIES: phosphopantetheine-binding protein [unclassified Frankia]